MINAILIGITGLVKEKLTLFCLYQYVAATLCIVQ